MRSVRERWAVDEEMKRRCLEVVKGLLDHEDVEIQLGAIRAVCSMEKMNLDSELKKQESHKSSFQQYLQMNIQPAAPDYEYLQWKQQKLVDEAREQARREAIANGELDAQAIEHEQAGAATAAMIEKKKSGQLAPLGYFAREAVAKRQNG